MGRGGGGRGVTDCDIEHDLNHVRYMTLLNQHDMYDTNVLAANSKCHRPLNIL